MAELRVNVRLAGARYGRGGKQTYVTNRVWITGGKKGLSPEGRRAKGLRRLALAEERLGTMQGSYAKRMRKAIKVGRRALGGE
jgi:hypothetical protein